MTTHKFEVEDAEKYGIEKAILLEHLKFHQQANEGNKNLQFDGKTFAFIKPSTIKEMYPYLNYASVRRWLKELEEDGVIESIKPKAKGGYHLKYYHVYLNDQNDQSNVQDDQSLNDQNDQSSIVTNVKSYQCEKYNAQFEEFWELYDKKKGKKKALKEWEKIDPSEIPEILENVPIFKTHYSNKEYLPYPRKYLYNQYWKDEDFQKPKQSNINGYHKGTVRPTRGDRQVEQLKTFLSAN